MCVCVCVYCDQCISLSISILAGMWKSQCHRTTLDYLRMANVQSQLSLKMVWIDNDQISNSAHLGMI